MQRDDDSHLTSSITNWLLLWDQEDQMYQHTFPHPVFKRVGLAVWRRFSSVSGLLAHFHGIATRLPPNRPIYTFVGRNDLPQSGERVIKYSAVERLCTRREVSPSSPNIISIRIRIAAVAEMKTIIIDFGI